MIPAAPLSRVTLPDLLGALSRHTARMARQVMSAEAEVGTLLQTRPGHTPAPALQNIDLVRQELDAMAGLFDDLAGQMRRAGGQAALDAAIEAVPLASLRHALQARPVPPDRPGGQVDFF